MEKSWRGVIGVGGHLARRSWAVGLPHYLTALVAVQGATFVAQLATARLVTPAAFGIIRTVEATLGLALVLGSAGLPSLAVKSIAAIGSPELQGRLLRRLLRLVALTSGVVALSLVAGSPWIVAPDVRPWLIRMAALLVPMALGRTALNFFQGIRQVQRVSIYVAGASVVALAVVIILVSVFGLPGWVASRYLGEGLMAGTAISLCWPFVRRGGDLPDFAGRIALFKEGGTLSLSLLVRSAIDNVPVLSLGWFGVRGQDVGFFGLGSLVAAALLLGPGALNNIALPRLVAAHQQRPGGALGPFKRLQAAGLALTLPASLVLAAGAPFLLRHLAPDYLPGVGLLQALVLIVPFRAVTSASGAALLATDRVEATLRFNLLTLTATIGAISLLVPRFGARGAVYAIVVAEALSALLYVVGAYRSVRSPDGAWSRS